MIQIVKPDAPDILKNDGEKRKKEFCADYEKGVREFDFKNDKIYNNKEVKALLIKLHHGKCCYCESKITANSPGDVEHFRPKSGSQQKKGDKIKKPGYYWLAFEWENLFFACDICNRSYKKNLFPLKNPSKRAICHNDNCDEEEPLFIHPEKNNPEEFISFRGAIIYSLDDDKNSKGNVTIKGLGLDRIELENRRRVVIETLQRLYVIANATPELPESQEAFDYLQKSAANSNEYSAMINAALAVGFEF